MSAFEIGFLFVCVAAALAVCAGSLQNGFVWDDPLVLRQLDHIRGLGDLLTPPDAIPKFYYRPLIFLTFLVDRAIAGDNPWQFHLTVLIWHAVATALVFFLARRLLGPERVLEAGLGALLFAVHPIHVESVAWIAGRSDVIAAVFVVLAVLFGAQSSPSSAWLAGTALLLACWSKEVGLCALVLVPAWDALIGGNVRWRRYPPLLLAAAVYFVSRYAGIGAVGGGLASAAGVPQIVRDLLAAVGWYAAKLFLPLGLNAYVPAVPDGPTYPLGGVVVLGLTIGAAVWAWRSGRGDVAFLLFWWLATLAPSLLVIVRRSASAVLAERYAYLPSVALVVLLAWLLARLRPPSKPGWRVAVAGSLMLTVLAAAQSVARTRIWKDNLSFWSDVASKVPGDALPQRELADAYMARDQLDEAEKQYQLAISLESGREGRVMALNNLANLYVRRRQYEQAEALYRQGLEIYPHSHLYSGLGRTAIERARASTDPKETMRLLNVARDAFTQAVIRDSQDHKSHNLLGQVLLNLGDRAGAREHFEASLRIQPTGTIADVARDFLKQLN